MIYARIENGIVAELFTPPNGVSITDCFHPDLIWVDVSSISPTPKPGWTYSGVAFIPPSAPVVDVRPLAQAALDKSDTTVIRCVEHKVDVPAEWLAYRAALREIVNGTALNAMLPAQPPYPANT